MEKGQVELNVSETKDREGSVSPEMVKFHEAMKKEIDDETLANLLDYSKIDEKLQKVADPLKVSILKQNKGKARLPRVNCPEKIVFCLDLCPDKKPFVSKETLVPPLTMMKQVIESFVRGKKEIDDKHEYALMSLYDGGTWAGEFTTDVDELVQSMESMTKVSSQARCNLSAVFQSYMEKAIVPVKPHPECDMPSYVLRLILIYARSSVIPRFQDESTSFNLLQTVPYFFLDIVYVHETPSSANLCQDILNALCEICDDSSYVFEVIRDVSRLQNIMAKLLAHPLQRDQIDYTKPIEEILQCQ